MFLVANVENFPLYKERKQVIIQNCFWIDIDHQILGVF